MCRTELSANVCYAGSSDWQGAHWGLSAIALCESAGAAAAPRLTGLVGVSGGSRGRRTSGEGDGWSAERGVILDGHRIWAIAGHVAAACSRVSSEGCETVGRIFGPVLSAKALTEAVSENQEMSYHVYSSHEKMMQQYGQRDFPP